MQSLPLRVAVVCSSNQNRSMEAHSILSKRGFSVRSFGTGAHVKLPGPAPDKPNVYDFRTTYDQMYNDLLMKDKDLYTQNGILHMLDRNKRIKPRPERFQNCKDLFDLILTCEERVYDQVVEGQRGRGAGKATAPGQAAGRWAGWGQEIVASGPPGSSGQGLLC